MTICMLVSGLKVESLFNKPIDKLDYFQGDQGAQVARNHILITWCFLNKLKEFMREVDIMKASEIQATE